MATRSPSAPGGVSAPPVPPVPPVPRAGRRRPSLRVTVLSLAIAAIAATWLPFSVLYISALSQRSAAPPAITTTYAPGGSTPAHGATVTTRTSAGVPVQSVQSAPAQASASTSVTSRAS